MSMECVKVKFEILDKKRVDKEAQKLLYDREFLRACLAFFGQDSSDNFFLPSKEEILNEEALFTQQDFRNLVLKFGDAFGYDATYNVWY
jgi:hypothetical protein